MDTTPLLPPQPAEPLSPAPAPAAPPRRLPVSLVVAVVLVLAAGVGYTLGRVRSTPSASPAGAPVTPVPSTNPAPSTSGTPPATQPVALNAEEVAVGNKTIVSGTVAEVTPSGFTVRVTSRTMNTSSGALGEQSKLYTVKVTAATKLTRTTTTVAMPAGGGTPKLTQTTQTIKLADLAPEQSVTVVSSTAGVTLTALEVRVSVVVRQ